MRHSTAENGRITVSVNLNGELCQTMSHYAACEPRLMMTAQAQSIYDGAGDDCMVCTRSDREKEDAE